MGVFLRRFFYIDKIFANNLLRVFKAADIVFINYYNKHIGQWRKDNKKKGKRLYICYDSYLYYDETGVDGQGLLVESSGCVLKVLKLN